MDETEEAKPLRIDGIELEPGKTQVLVENISTHGNEMNGIYTIVSIEPWIGEQDEQ